MAAGRREQGDRVVRLKPAGVTPIEVWDFELGDDRILWDVASSPEFPEVLAHVLDELRSGRGESRSARLRADRCRAFDAVYVCGGASSSRRLRERLRRASFEVIFASGGDGDDGAASATTFCGERGGFELLRQLGRRGMVVDVGQTQIKVSIDGRRFVHERDWERLPIVEVMPEDLRSHRTRLREFLADSLHEPLSRCAEEARLRLEAAIVALPSELDDDGTPHGCSYAGMRGYRELVPDALDHADLPDTAPHVLNDAELAAVSAQCVLGAQRPPKVLVMTVGFGVGAALLER